MRAPEEEQMNRPQRMKEFAEHIITLTYEGESYKVVQGTSVEQFLTRHAKDERVSLPYGKNPVVALQVNNEVMSMGESLVVDGEVEPVLMFSPIGKRMYRHTISYLLAYASRQIFPERRLVIGHSLGNGFYFNFEGIYQLTKSDIEALKMKMSEIISSSVTIHLYLAAYRQAIEYFDKMGFTATKKLLEYRNDPFIPLYACDDFLDISFEPLLPNTALAPLWELRPYGDRGMLLRYPLSSDYTTIPPFHDNPLLFSVFKESKEWGSILKVDCLGAMNDICGSAHLRTFIRMNENLQQKKINSIAEQIVRKKGVKVVFVAGPSSSGKTTFTMRLGLHLRMLGYHPVQISLDNYYRSKDKAPIDEEGNIDLEALEALDLDLFRENIKDLYEGKEVLPPRFEFTGGGTRYFDLPPVSLKDETIILIEGIHGLNPSLVPDIDAATTFKIYISALTQLNLDDHNRISTTDNRILRRIVRDYRYRGTSAQQTLEMWPSVERGESRHIFPFQNKADVMINSALEYELSVLKAFAEPLLKTVKPDATEAYPTARRLIAFLENIYPINPMMVPSESLLREFIGGSEFHGEC